MAHAEAIGADMSADTMHGGLPLPLGERVGVRGSGASIRPSTPLTRRATRVDLSPPGRGERKNERI
ncbi:hypothetical protein ASC80_02055 [Afipia sp. Root123D2]|nr:hypothetical protein ASC80_02055 [Afipia sp. Root123D2]